MKISTILMIGCIIVLFCGSLSVFLIIEGLNDDKIIKQQNEELLRQNISFTDNLDIFDTKIGYYRANVENLSNLLIKTKHECDQEKKNNNQALLDDYTNNTLCYVKKERCLDELRDVKLNLSKLSKKYNCLKYNKTEDC